MEGPPKRRPNPLGWPQRASTSSTGVKLRCCALLTRPTRGRPPIWRWTGSAATRCSRPPETLCSARGAASRSARPPARAVPRGAREGGHGEKRAGSDPMVFHDLRHTFGTLAVEAWPLTDVQAYMGHADIEATMIYAHHVPKTNAAARLGAACRRHEESSRAGRFQSTRPRDALSCLRTPRDSRGGG